jgi:tetratricopeptide (TPR) repeat protein
MFSLSMPPAVSHNLSRARSLLKRDDTLRALEAMIAGIDAFHPNTMPGKLRFEVEVLISECVQELNRQPMVRALLEKLSHSPNASVPYQPGKEVKLQGVLHLVFKALKESIASRERNAVEEREKRKELLLQKGTELLKAGDKPRGKAVLRVVAEEYGKEKGIYLQVSDLLLEHNLQFEAGEMLERSIEEFPKEAAAYAKAAQCWIKLREYEKAEAVYLGAMKNFGKHPRTLLNMAKLYLLWNKKEKAFSVALEAYNKDKSLEEAKEIVDRFS